MTLLAVEWISPAAGLIATVLELDEFNSPNLVPLVATFNNLSDPTIEFKVQSGEFPQDLIIDNDLKCIRGIVDEMDTYVSGFEKPEDFNYDSETKSGGNYATYGSDLVYSKTFTFTLRAYKSSMADSNGDLPAYAYDDRIFHIIVRNNYSTSRDRFMTNYFTLEEQAIKGLLLDDTGKQLTAEEWILFQKLKGYYT